MIDSLKQAVEFLKRRVQYNLQIIRYNEQLIRDILGEPVSVERTERLDEKLKTNKQILQENQESLKIQLSIIQFMDKYKKDLDSYADLENINKELQQRNTDEAQNNKMDTQGISREDYFHLTANKGIVFDEEHPYFNDHSFYNELMQHFIDSEDYEMCLTLRKVRPETKASE